MALESQGWVVLKIYSPEGVLLIARPCVDQAIADKWFEEYAKAHPNVAREIAAMVPRI